MTWTYYPFYIGNNLRARHKDLGKIKVPLAKVVRNKAFWGKARHRAFGGRARHRTFGERARHRTFGGRARHTKFGGQVRHMTFGEQARQIILMGVGPAKSMRVKHTNTGYIVFLFSLFALPAPSS